MAIIDPSYFNSSQTTNDSLAVYSYGFDFPMFTSGDNITIIDKILLLVIIFLMMIKIMHKFFKAPLPKSIQVSK